MYGGDKTPPGGLPSQRGKRSGSITPPPCCLYVPSIVSPASRHPARDESDVVSKVGERKGV